MEIRQLRAEDLDELRLLVQQVYSDSELAMWFDKAPSQEDLNELFRLKMLGISSGSSIDLIAVEKGRIIGECEIVFTGESHMVGIIVAKESRRKGIGQQLLTRGIEEARRLGLDSIYAEVVEDNAAGMGFFTKNGFEKTGISEKQFSREEKSHRILYFEKEL